MAKEIHGYIKTLLVIAAVIFAGGGYAMKVKDNTGRIEKTEVVNDKQDDDIHALELSNKDIHNLAAKSLDTMVLMNGKLESIQKIQMEQATIQAVNSEKLRTLTKE